MSWQKEVYNILVSEVVSVTENWSREIGVEKLEWKNGILGDRGIMYLL